MPSYQVQGDTSYPFGSGQYGAGQPSAGFLSLQGPAPQTQYGSMGGQPAGWQHPVITPLPPPPQWDIALLYKGVMSLSLRVKFRTSRTQFGSPLGAGHFRGTPAQAQVRSLGYDNGHNCSRAFPNIIALVVIICGEQAWKMRQYPYWPIYQGTLHTIKW